MRILDEDTNQSRNRVTLYLERAEAQQLLSDLGDILEAGHHHAHVTSADDRKEITICLYDESSLEDFDERSRLLITADK